MATMAGGVALGSVAGNAITGTILNIFALLSVTLLAIP